MKLQLVVTPETGCPHGQRDIAGIVGVRKKPFLGVLVTYQRLIQNPIE